MEKVKISFYDVWPQVWKGSLANGMSLLTGINTGFSTVFITKLMADPNIKNFSKTEASWIASLAVLFGPVGAFCIGPIMDRFGRKKAMIIANALPIICWALTYSVTESIWPLYIGRTIGGAAAMMLTAVGVYVSEISHPKVRDVMMVMIGSFVSIGTLITMILGSVFEWHRASLFITILSIVSFISSFFLPESPLWLVSFKPTEERLNEALSLTKYFNRSQTLCDIESKRLKEIYLNSIKSDISKEDSGQNWFNKNFKLFTKRNVCKPMTILFIIFFFWAFTGVFVVLMYSANIFRAIGSNFKNGFNEYSATIVIGAVKLIMTLVSTFVSFKYGRRTLMIISGVGMAVTISTAATFQIFSDSKLDFSKTIVNSTVVRDDFQVNISIISVISLILYVLFGALALTNIPWALVNELLPTKARALGGSIISAYSSIILFGVLKVTPLTLEVISLSNLFFIFGVLSLLSAIYVYFKLPETFGKNFEEIEKSFIKKTIFNNEDEPLTRDLKVNA